MTTIRDVAQQAGVSIATVSRVMNDTDYVSDEVRERVLEVAQELHYRPSRVAQNLRACKTQTIGILVPQVDQPLFSKLVFAIQTTLMQHEYHTLVANTLADPHQEKDYLQHMLGQRVEGVLLVPFGQHHEAFEQLHSNDIPTVLINHDVPTLETADRILCDDGQGAFEGMQHLIAQGHRHICVIGAPDYSYALQERLIAAEHAAMEAPHDVHFEFVTLPLPDVQAGYSTALSLFQHHPRPTAIFALGGSLALGVYQAAQESHLRLPDELEIVGYDDIGLTQFSLPGLTTVAQPIKEMGKAATRLLLERINGGHHADMKTITFNSSLQSWEPAY